MDESSQQQPDEAAIRRDVVAFLRSDVAPALANHLGGIEVTEVGGRRVQLRLTASCRTCYFRRGCIEELVLPELQRKFDDNLQFAVR